jgi:hypothetical protein
MWLVACFGLLIHVTVVSECVTGAGQLGVLMSQGQRPASQPGPPSGCKCPSGLASLQTYATSCLFSWQGRAIP